MQVDCKDDICVGCSCSCGFFSVVVESFVIDLLSSPWKL